MVRISSLRMYSIRPLGCTPSKEIYSIPWGVLHPICSERPQLSPESTGRGVTEGCTPSLRMYSILLFEVYSTSFLLSAHSFPRRVPAAALQTGCTPSLGMYSIPPLKCTPPHFAERPQLSPESTGRGVTAGCTPSIGMYSIPYFPFGLSGFVIFPVVVLPINARYTQRCHG